MGRAEWFAWHGLHGRAADFYRRARAAGADVPAADLGRALWLSGNPGAAAAEFGRESNASAPRPATPPLSSADRLYLQLCRAAAKDQAAARTGGAASGAGR